jgi:FdrA protein
MGTPRNKELLIQSGLATADLEKAGADDLVIVVKGEAGTLEAAEQAVKRFLVEAAPKKGGTKDSLWPQDLEAAVKRDPDLGLALISVAGDYARYEAAKAVNAGLDVMLYSDNISLEDEIALKKQAARRGVMVMGPDCGTAIIDGVPLAFANQVRKGPVGLVGASGTGLQEVICLLDRLGVGISRAYGTGGRDLKDEVGGLTAVAALHRLERDKETKVVVLLGKPPGMATRGRLAALLSTLGKPVLVHYLGVKDYARENAADLHHADNLTDLAVLTARQVSPGLNSETIFFKPPEPVRVRRGYLRGLFGGGTLGQEAAELAAPFLEGEKYSNLNVAGFNPVKATDPSQGHCFWDLGDDDFTVGRPHPMMAPELKMERLVSELGDPEVSVVLMDMVIGYGTHQDQAGELVRALAKTASRQAEASNNAAVVVSVCGTDADKPSRQSQVALLEKAGVIVCGSNAQAAIFAAKTVAGAARGGA